MGYYYTLPPITSRSTWNAREARSGMTYEPTKNKIIVHHTTSRNFLTGSDAYAEMRRIQNKHMDNSNYGFDDIGYHFVITYDGEVIQGRQVNYRGAHASGNQGNYNSIGVALMGNYTGRAVSDVQEMALVRLLGYYCERKGIDPTKIYGHRDFDSSTECPGTYAYSYCLPEVRRRLLATVNKG